MRVRVAVIWKHPKSGIYWFRMGVPERHRAAIGQREIKESLRTRSEVEARLKYAAKLIEVTSLFARLDDDIASGVDDDARRICRNGFETLARRNLANHDDAVTTLADAHNNVIVAMLTMLAFRVRCSWGEDHRIRAEHHLLGDSDEVSVPATMAAIADPEEQDAIIERINFFEGRFVPVLDQANNEMQVMRGNHKTQGIAYRELAAALLLRRDWKFVELEVLVIAEAAQAPLRQGQKIYDALAEQILVKLADYRSETAPSRTLLNTPNCAGELEPNKGATATTGYKVKRTLTDAYEQWCRNKGIVLNDQGMPMQPDKTAAEWHLARCRFVELFGDLRLSEITAEMVHLFRDVVAGLPSRPKAKVKRLPLREQVAAASRDRLRVLNPNTIKKNVIAIQTMLGAAKAIGWSATNVAMGVTVAGAGHVGDERDFFTLEELGMIFSSRLMTDPRACSDSMFFIILLEALQGGRPGELAKLKPTDVGVFDGTPTIRIRRSENRRQKTRNSVRDIPLHQVAVDAGVLDLASIRLSERADWLFNDLTPDKYGDRFKLMSRAINRELRKIGVEASDKSFYSARHAHKRESRRQNIPEENSDQMSGHATSSTGRKYGQGVPIETLKENVNRVTYATIDWEPVVNCALKRIRRLTEQASRAA